MTGIDLRRNVIVLGIAAAAAMTFIAPPRSYFLASGQPSTVEEVCSPLLDKTTAKDELLRLYTKCVDGAPLNVSMWLVYMVGIALATALLVYLLRPRNPRAD